MLPDGRLHLNHGPIDLIVEARGEAGEVEAARDQALARFSTILTELVAELPMLRMAVIPRGGGLAILSGSTARRMQAAVSPLASQAFITPMAAVAGAVADEVLTAMLAGRNLSKAYVNNGGDIAIHLGAGESLTAAIAGAGSGLSDRVTVAAGDPVRGIATSGWRGRSHSLGIADAVTVLARTAAGADAAATLIANAVDLPGSPKIGRRPARELSPDSDLGARSVTVSVAPLAPTEAEEALEQGLILAERFRRAGLIEAAALFLSRRSRLCGPIGIGSRPMMLSRGSAAA